MKLIYSKRNIINKYIKINICVFFYIILFLIKFVFKNNKIYNNTNNLFKKLSLTSEIIKIYSNLYDANRNGYIKPKFEGKVINYPIQQQKKGILICSIGKKENLYIREYVDYYYLLGVDKIIIFDNNDINDERFDYILEDYIKKKYIDIIDIRGFSSMQIPIYNYCYQQNKNNYDWIGFLDIDEYIYILNNVSFKNYIFNKVFEKCQTIYFNWIIYTDNDKIKYENITLNKRFTKSKIKDNNGKSFVRGGYENLLIPTTMIPGINIYYFCNSNGERIYPNNFYNNDYQNNLTAFIKHYSTKTAEEFCYKIKKGNAHYHKKHPNYIQNLKNRVFFFFFLNKITKEKIEILEKCSGIDLNSLKIKIH